MADLNGDGLLGLDRQTDNETDEDYDGITADKASNTSHIIRSFHHK